MLWDDLLTLKRFISLPWVIMGYLNVVLSANEKVLEDGSMTDVTSELRDFLDEAGLEDLKFYGQHLTWSNHHTWCKLDRVLVNEEWLDAYEHFCSL